MTGRKLARLLLLFVCAPGASAQVGVRPGDVQPELPPFEALASPPDPILPPIPRPPTEEPGRIGAEARLFVRAYDVEIDEALELGAQLTDSKVVEDPFDELDIRSETAS